MLQQPILLTTGRLHLRPFRLTDAEQLFLLNQDAAVMRFVPDLPFADEAAARQFLVDYLPIYQRGFGRLAMIRQTDAAFLGWCGLKEQQAGVADIGFRLHKAHWGQGYASEAAQACLLYGKEQLGLQRIIGHAAVGNGGSRRVLEKIGLQQVGFFEEPDWNGIAYALDL